MWSHSVYTVMDQAQSLHDSVNYYHLEDWLVRQVKDHFYEPRLQKVKGLPDQWHMDKKLKYNGHGEVLVNGQAVAPDYQTWIPTET